MNKKNNYEFIFQWILLNKLAVGNSPFEKENINLLKKNRVKNILALCSSDEKEWYKDISQDFATKRIVLPDSNSKEILSLDQFKKAFFALEDFINDDTTFVHCFASMERSPMLCIFYIMKTYTMNIENALDYVLRVHKYTKPTNAQLKLINKFSMMIEV